MSSGDCGRCHRPAPPDRDEYLSWEAIVLDGLVVLICPGCLTDAERQEIDDDWIAADEEISRCPRWARPGERNGEPYQETRALRFARWLGDQLWLGDGPPRSPGA